MKILGIQRSAEFSPNMVDFDAAILLAVKDELVACGHEVDIVNENDLSQMDYDVSSYDRVYGMERKLTIIKELKKRNPDKLFVNPLQGIIDTTNRYDLCKTFIRNKIKMPQTLLFHGAQISCVEQMRFPLWIKRGDGPAEQKVDTSYVVNIDELQAVVRNFQQRDINRYVAMQHVKGDLIKFYGVEGTDFFDWSYVYGGFSKFGLEEINGKEHGYPFKEVDLKAIVDAAARASNVPVYGGDAIIDENCDIFIIDFNDFPSFARCREKAAKAIAERIEK